jgi:hypothetical protein
MPHDYRPGPARANDLASGATAPVPGKQTLTQQLAVQLRAADGGGDHSADATSIARSGLSGPGSALPHRDAIESSYGVDLGAVSVHTGPAATAACDDLHAEAFTMGSSIAFASPSPSMHLAAHEAAHVVQQSNGVQLSGKMGKVGDSYEVQADSAADRAVAGQSASDLLPSVGAIAPAPSNGAVQCFHKPFGGTDFRVSDDGLLGVGQDSALGSKTAYATPGLIASASAALKAKTSVIGLKAGSLTAKLPDKTGTEHDVVDVDPVNNKNKTEGVGMDLWADCGRSAATVSGTDGGSGMGGGGSVAKYKKDGKTKIASGPQDWMEIQKVKMMMDLFTTENSFWKIWKPKYESKLDLAGLKTKIVAYEAVKAQWATEADDNTKETLGQTMARLAAELDRLARVEYEKLAPDARQAFDRAAGINMYADPEIGEMFHISTGGANDPAAPGGMTWNFHWAGVVMKSGADTMTLENYSVSEYDRENTDWVYQLYGVGNEAEAGQSFHEHHEGLHQHGLAPTTMVATRPPKK